MLGLLLSFGFFILPLLGRYIGVSSMFWYLFPGACLAQFGAFMVRIASVFLVAKDAEEMGAGRAFLQERFFRTRTWRPASWAILVFFFWTLLMPLYILKRRAIFEANIMAYYYPPQHWGPPPIPHVQYCVYCGQPAVFIPQFQAWYCGGCRRYQ